MQDDYFERRLVGRLGYAGPPSLGNVRSQHGASIFRFSRKDGKDDDRVMGGGVVHQKAISGERGCLQCQVLGWIRGRQIGEARAAPMAEVRW